MSVGRALGASHRPSASPSRPGTDAWPTALRTERAAQCRRRLQEAQWQPPRAVFGREPRGILEGARLRTGCAAHSLAREQRVRRRRLRAAARVQMAPYPLGRVRARARFGPPSDTSPGHRAPGLIERVQEPVPRPCARRRQHRAGMAYAISAHSCRPSRAGSLWEGGQARVRSGGSGARPMERRGAVFHLEHAIGVVASAPARTCRDAGLMIRRKGALVKHGRSCAPE